LKKGGLERGGKYRELAWPNEAFCTKNSQDVVFREIENKKEKSYKA
jgi:hypothetical protein